MVTTRHTRARAAVLGGLALALALTGCAKDNDVQATPKAPAPTAEPPTITETPPADPEAAEKKAIGTAFASMWAEQMKAYVKADAKGTALEKYATTNALGQIRLDLARMQKAGTVVRRGPRQTGATVTSLDLTAQLPAATLTTCVDMNTYEQYDTRAKKVIPLPTNQPRRYLMTVSLEKWDAGWIVTDLKPEGARTC